MIVFIMCYVSVLVIFRAAMGMKKHVLMGIGHQVNFSDGSGTDLKTLGAVIHRHKGFSFSWQKNFSQFLS